MRPPLKVIFEVIFFIIAISGLWVLSDKLSVFPLDDFIEYWSAGRVNLTGGNPYDAGQMLNLEKSAGWAKDEALMMLNPPWTLSIAMLIGVFSYDLSRFLWFITGIGIICLCAMMLWKIYDGRKHKEWIAWLALFSFGPILRALKSGQITIIAMLGLVCFAFFYQKKKLFWAGFFASLILVKPQLLYLVLLAMLVWSFTSKKYHLIFGFSSGVMLLLGFTLIINPHVLAQYFFMIQSYRFESWITTTIGANLRLLLGPERFYLEFLPSLVGIVWFFIYWGRHRHSFEWISDLPLIVLVSATTTAYAWTLDYMVCIIAILQIGVILLDGNWTKNKIVYLIIYAAIDLVIVFGGLTQSWYWWVPLSFLIWYVLASRQLYKTTNPKVSPDIISI